MADQHYYELWTMCPRLWEERWSVFCFEQSALGIETMEEGPDRLVLRVFFDQDQEASQLQQLPTLFRQSHIDAPVIEVLRCERKGYEDWHSNWKAYFEPLDVGQRFTVCPPWKVANVSPQRKALVIDPGRGFGTGSHASTALALELLEEHLLSQPELPETLLDVGTGSGILSIAAALLGIPKITALDIDPASPEEVRHNSQLNGVAPQVDTLLGEATCLQHRYPLIISNMLLHEILHVYPSVRPLLQSEGYWLCSGLLTEQYDTLCEAFAADGLTPCLQRQHEEWQAILFSHKKLVISTGLR